MQMSQKIDNPSTLIQPCFTIGLHGVGGSGKTTFSKLFCNVVLRKYLGRVCHIELGTTNSLELGKQVLRQVTNLDNVFIDAHASDPERVCHPFAFKLIIVMFLQIKMKMFGSLMYIFRFIYRGKLNKWLMYRVFHCS